MKDSQVQVLPALSNSPENLVFENKLVAQDKSYLNRTFTYDIAKRQRLRDFSMEDAIRGFLPRAKSSGPRNTYKDDCSKLKTKEYFSCTLPSLDNGHTIATAANKCCTLRPWSRTQEELRKYKQTLTECSSKALSCPFKENKK
ncbi:unnamed protein product [Auanema sp. JU1783]|nr:unnamed protein product [Auanema sp. JU1783]